jgi:hypothetical protein
MQTIEERVAVLEACIGELPEEIANAVSRACAEQGWAIVKAGLAQSPAGRVVGAVGSVIRGVGRKVVRMASFPFRRKVVTVPVPAPAM